MEEEIRTIMEIEILEDNKCILRIEEDKFNGYVEKNKVIMENFFMTGTLMNFLGHHSNDWQIGDVIYQQAIMTPCSIVEGRMFCPKLEFIKEAEEWQRY